MDNIGDFVMSLPIIPALRQAFPVAEISMVVHPAVEELASRVCDRVFTYASPFVYKGNHREQGSLMSSIRKAQELNNGDYDLIVDLRSDPMTLIFAVISSAKFRIDISSERIGPTIRKIWAMVTGMPVISLHHPLTLIKDGWNGFLARDFEEMADKSRLLINDLQLAKQLGKNAKKTIMERYHINSFVQRWNDVLSAAVRKREQS